MSLKQEIETWVQALSHYDNQEYEEALNVFYNIPDTSKILFNCGVIYATLGEHEKAVQCYQQAVRLDQYLAIAYFQEGVSNFLLGDFEEALANFNDTLLYLRGNTFIDYEQLGLKFRLYSCEVLFNRGLCYIYLRQMGPGLQDLEYATQEKVTPDHSVIDDAIREKAEGYTVFSIPVGVLYRPNEAKVKNLKTKDYLGKAKLIATCAGPNNHSLPRFDSQWAPSAIDDRPPENISYAATNLVQKNLRSRSRQQFEPPLNRNLLPPTPPPDSEKASTAGASSSGGSSRSSGDSSTSASSLGSTGRTASVRAMRPPRLNLDRPGAGSNGRTISDERPPAIAAAKPRIGTTRTASEPQGPHSRQRHLRTLTHDTVRQPPYRETTHHQRRGLSDSGFAPPDDIHDTTIYTSPNRSLASTNSRRSGPSRQHHHYIDQAAEEEEKQPSDSHGEDSSDSASFEMLPAASTRKHGNHSHRRQPPLPPPVEVEVRRFRVKVHAADDTRYVMIDPSVGFGEFEGKIRDKFGFRSLLRIKMQDEGDMITMGDQEDLELLLASATEVARREGSDMAKMEIWVEERL